MKKILALFCTLFVISALNAQVNLTGHVLEITDSTQLIGASVTLRKSADSTIVRQAITDTEGSFRMFNIPAGGYIMEITFIGYLPYRRAMELGYVKDLERSFYLNQDSKLLNSVDIIGQTAPVSTKNDTTEMRSSAFKVNPDASAEDLVTKMPGIRMQDGKVTAQGEEVKKVLVDGKPFFGNDPSATLRNLPADAVERVQVFDAMSDQAQFTGVDDGNSEKTINIIFKPDRRTGNFGRVYGGMADNGKYKAGGVLNMFNNDRKITILAQSNDINEQNFDSGDMSAMQTQSMGGHGRGRGRFGNNNPLINNLQNGVVKTHAVGINFTNEWAKKLNLSASAFGNMSEANLQNTAIRQYYNQQLYNEQSNSGNESMTGRGNVRLEYKIDSTQQAFYTGSINYGQNNFNAVTLGNLNMAEQLLSSNIIRNNNSGSNLSFSNRLNYMKRLNKMGRNFSLQANQDYSNNLPIVRQDQLTDFADSADVRNNQEITSNNYNRAIGGSIDYSEPLDSFSSLAFSYDINYKVNDINKEAYQLEDAGGEVLFTFIRELSNITKNNYTSHAPRLSYRFNKKQLRFGAGLRYQYALMDADQTFPNQQIIKRTFKNLLPEAHLRWNKARSESMGFFFRARTNEPSVTQLQEVINNTNNLVITSGNPELIQSTRYMLFMRYNKTNNTNYTSWNFGVRSFADQDYITNRIITSDQDTMITNVGLLPRGVQYSYPVNLDGYRMVNGNLDFTFPMRLVRSNITLSTSAGFTRAPGMLNDQLNFSNTVNLGGGISIASNFSQNVDFNVFSRPQYNNVRNNILNTANNKYFSLLSGARLNFIIAKNWVINTDISHYLNDGLSSEINANFVLWNAAIAYKFLKNYAGEIRLQAFDLLKSNKAIARTYADTYYEDTNSNVLTQYFMLVASYKIR